MLRSAFPTAHASLFPFSHLPITFDAQKILQLSIGRNMFTSSSEKREILCEFEMNSAMLFLGEKKKVESRFANWNKIKMVENILLQISLKGSSVLKNAVWPKWPCHGILSTVGENSRWQADNETVWVIWIHRCGFGFRRPSTCKEFLLETTCELWEQSLKRKDRECKADSWVVSIAKRQVKGEHDNDVSLKIKLITAFTFSSNECRLCTLSDAVAGITS